MEKLRVENAFWERDGWTHRVKVLLDNGKTKYGKISGFATPEAANKSFREYEAEYEKRQREFILAKQEKKECTFTFYLKHWFEDIFSERIESTTRMAQAYSVYNLILPSVGNDMKLRLVNADYLNEVLERVSGISPSAGNMARNTLHMMFKDAVVEGLIKRNPVPDTKRYPRPKSKVTIYNKEQISIFLRTAKSDNWYLEYMLGMFLGLRKGEILGLKFSDFNYEKETVTINRQLVSDPVVKAGGYVESYGVVERPPKTANSVRTLKVPRVVFEELELRKRRIDQQKEAMGDAYEDHDYVSCQKNGRGHHCSAMNIALTKVCKRAALPKISVHSLRHMYATILIEQGVPLVKISACLGHSSVNTTFEYYCDVMNAQENVLEFMNDNYVKGA